MQSTTEAARRRGHLSRHERQRLARTEAFSRRTAADRRAGAPVKLRQDELELIDRLVREDRTVVSSALLAIAGIDGGEAIRGAVLARVSETARWAQLQGAISTERGGQIVRHVNRALERAESRIAA